MEFLKNFADWFKLKPKLDNRNHKPPFVKKGQIWWCHLGKKITPQKRERRKIPNIDMF